MTVRAFVTCARETRKALTDVAERIETLRIVHEQLYAAGTTDRLRIRQFVMQLVESLCSMHEEQSGKVRLDLALEEVVLAPEAAVHLGLILNEFVTNSLKYAFDGGSRRSRSPAQPSPCGPRRRMYVRRQARFGLPQERSGGRRNPPPAPWTSPSPRPQT